jgi:hypothetical protein
MNRTKISSFWSIRSTKRVSSRFLNTSSNLSPGFTAAACFSASSVRAAVHAASVSPRDRTHDAGPQRAAASVRCPREGDRHGTSRRTRGGSLTTELLCGDRQRLIQQRDDDIGLRGVQPFRQVIDCGRRAGRNPHAQWSLSARVVAGFEIPDIRPAARVALVKERCEKQVRAEIDCQVLSSIKNPGVNFQRRFTVRPVSFPVRSDVTKISIAQQWPILETNAAALDAVVCLLAAKDFLDGRAMRRAV